MFASQYAILLTNTPFTNDIDAKVQIKGWFIDLSSIFAIHSRYHSAPLNDHAVYYCLAEPAATISSSTIKVQHFAWIFSTWQYLQALPLVILSLLPRMLPITFS